MEEEWQAEHFNSRRIAHGKKGKAGKKGGIFDPRRAYGVYQLKCPALAKIPKHKLPDGCSEATLEIHGPVEDRDDALVCTLALSGVLSGVAVLAGSRKILNSVVRELEDTGIDRGVNIDQTIDDVEGDDGSHDGGDSAQEGLNDEDIENPKSSIELADERERRRYAAFEKNSFRSPKFWMRWKGVVSTSNDDGLGGDSISRLVEVNGGYLVFAGNDCASFQGTLSCDALEWKSVKLSGSKIVSKARESKLSWNEVTADQ